MSESNGFSVYIGIVTEDRKLGSSVIQAYVKELTPFFKGGISDSTKTETYSLKDSSGGDASGSVSTSNSVTADYFGVYTNRTFPPDIVKGEQVLILRYSNADAYYWMSMGRNDNLRRGELHRISISDDMSIMKDLDDDNTYFMELDTKTTKRIRIQTSKSDGERYKYELIMNASEDFVVLGDDTGNKLIIESSIPRVKLINRDKSVLDLNGEDILIYAPRNIFIRADQTLSLGFNELKMQGSSSSCNITGDSENTVNGNSVNTINGNVMSNISGSYNLSVGSPTSHEYVSDYTLKINGATVTF